MMKCRYRILKNFSSKRRRNEELLQRKKSNEEAEESAPTKTSGETAESSAAPVKRVPISLEEMIERNKKEQEAISKVNQYFHLF